MDNQNGAQLKNALVAEEKLALEVNDKMPIQAAKIDKVFTNGQGREFFAVKNVSVCLREGETLGLLGPNGAGKSTMFNILSTYHPYTSGYVRIFGKQLTSNSSFFKKTGICAQDNIVWSTLSVASHLKIMRIIKNIPKKVQDEWLEIMGLTRFKNNCPYQLSSGMQRKLCFLMTVIGNPKFQFLDEVTTGLDPLARKQMREILKYQKKFYGATSVFTTHTMNEAERACDRILILVNGQACVLESVSQLKKSIGGFTLTLMKKEGSGPIGFEERRVILRALGNIGEADLVLAEETQQKAVFHVYSLNDLAGAFDGLETIIKDGTFEDFDLSMKNLEDLFLSVSKNQRPREQE